MKNTQLRTREMILAYIIVHTRTDKIVSTINFKPTKFSRVRGFNRLLGPFYRIQNFLQVTLVIHETFTEKG